MHAVNVVEAADGLPGHRRRPCMQRVRPRPTLDDAEHPALLRSRYVASGAAAGDDHRPERRRGCPSPMGGRAGRRRQPRPPRSQSMKSVQARRQTPVIISRRNKKHLIISKKILRLTCSIPLSLAYVSYRCCRRCINCRCWCTQ
jgi:hypothetical protein